MIHLIMMVIIIIIIFESEVEKSLFKCSHSRWAFYIKYSQGSELGVVHNVNQKKKKGRGWEVERLLAR